MYVCLHASIYVFMHTGMSGMLVYVPMCVQMFVCEFWYDMIVFAYSCLRGMLADPVVI